MLTGAQRERYRATGWVQIPGAVPAAACAAVVDALWRVLERRGMRRGDPDSWSAGPPSKLGRRLGAQQLAALAAPELIALIDDLLGAGSWERPHLWAQPLPIFPTAGPWDVPSRMWHLDYPVQNPPPGDWAVKMLCLLAPVAAREGGTLLLSGSHRLVEGLAARGYRGGSADVRGALAREHDWLRALMSPGDRVDRVRRFMVDGAALDEVPVRVEELTGAAGDVVLFHPWLLHAPAPNRGSEPRLVVGQNFTTRAGLAVYRPEGASSAAHG